MRLMAFDNVSKRYGRQYVLTDVSFELWRGKIIGLLGPNGCGKTTIMKLISGLVYPTAGEIRRDGRIRIKALIEEPVFYKGLSGHENLRYLSADEKITEDEIAAVVKAMNMCGYIRKRVGKYSMGMRRKLSLAYVLLGNSDLIVLDEPFNGLDPIAVGEVIRSIKERAEACGTAIFISSHILKEIQETCDEVIIVNGGGVIETANLRKGAHTVEIGFLTEKSVAAARSVLDITHASESSVEVKISDKRDIPEIICALTEAGAEIVYVKQKGLSIEEIYRNSAGGNINA